MLGPRLALIASAAAAIASIWAAPAAADSYAIDSDFGDEGVASLPGLEFSSQTGNTRWIEIKVQADGKIVALGERLAHPAQYEVCSEPVVVRLRPDGSPDPSFGTGGVVGPVSLAPICANVKDIAVAPDGEVYVLADCTNNPPSGTCGAQKTIRPDYPRTHLGDGIYVVALKPDGTLDTSFGEGGIYSETYDEYSCACTAPKYGKLPNRIVNYFGLTLEVVYDPEVGNDIAVLPNGDPIVAGTARVWAVNPNGYAIGEQPDYEQNWGMNILPDDPGENSDFVMLEDNPFSQDRPGSIELEQLSVGSEGNVHALAIRSDDTYTPEPFGTAYTYRPGSDLFEGASELGFPTLPAGVSATPAGIDVDGDDRAVVGFAKYENGSNWTIKLSRVLPDGALDTSFGSGGSAEFASNYEISPLFHAAPFAALPDGRVLLQAFGDELQRVTAAGALDPSFGCGGSVAMARRWREGLYLTGVMMQPDGKMLRFGWPGEGETKWSLYRLKPIPGDGCQNSELEAGLEEPPAGGPPGGSPEGGEQPGAIPPGEGSGSVPPPGAPTNSGGGLLPKTGGKGRSGLKGKSGKGRKGAHGKALHCRKGFKKVVVHSKARCVKKKDGKKR